jgi:hypothetical protein
MSIQNFSMGSLVKVVLLKKFSLIQLSLRIIHEPLPLKEDMVAAMGSRTGLVTSFINSQPSGQGCFEGWGNGGILTILPSNFPPIIIIIANYCNLSF